ncbi:MAG: hypothetical protein Q8P12_04235, partial [bacterium]|nr:hypothetical protein [bacterium]
MKTHPLIRAVYLYLFSIVGLILIVISGVRFLDMGMKAFVFTEAEKEQRLWSSQPPFPGIEVRKIAEPMDEDGLEPKETIELTAEEKARVDDWISSYNEWVKRRAEIDPITAQRHRDASSSLAMLLVGLPLYLYHWREIKREAR